VGELKYATSFFKQQPGADAFNATAVHSSSRQQQQPAVGLAIAAAASNVQTAFCSQQPRA
jgi:hypothetical protein